jgi:hypothetical protein
MGPASQQKMDMVSKALRQCKHISSFECGAVSVFIAGPKKRRKKIGDYPVLVAADAFDLAKEQKPWCKDVFKIKRLDAIAGDPCPIPCDPIRIPFPIPPIDR